jgi:16S rRNA (adenine1518-N6/adenine1519-N6)-dimethyltransferase
MLRQSPHGNELRPQEGKSSRIPAQGELTDPGALKGFLRRHGLWTDKGLGQHFLVSKPAVASIVDALDGVKGVFEIGPGPGVLTGPLSERYERVAAIEIDARFVRVLAESAPRAEIVQGDALEVDWLEHLRSLPTPLAIVSNLPYYITAPLLQRVADVYREFDRAVLMMQREVAVRIAAPAGHSERGSLSVFLQGHFSISRVVDVPAGSFLPPPKVDSRVLRFDPRSDAPGSDLYRLVRLGFAQPRKTLANNLAAGLGRPRDEVIDMFESLMLDEKVRAAVLTEAQWRALAERLRP